MNELHSEPGRIGRDPREEVWELFEPVFERITKAMAPWSVVELCLPQDQIQRVKSWASQIPRESLFSFETGSHSGKSIPTQAELLGCLLLIVAAETSRDTNSEDAVWPAVRSVFPECSPGRKFLFVQGQPSKLFKEILEAAARRFSFRHVLDSELAQKYFDTVKLQYGFTLRGARRNLHEWLVGLGPPLSVQILLGHNPRHPELSSESFQELWNALQAYRRDRVSKDRMEAVLRASPWVRAHWVPELLSQARVKLRSQTPVLIADAPTGVVQGVRLHWLAGAKPRLELELDHEALRTLASETRSFQICAAVDGRITGRWLRQSNGAWHGSNAIFCEPDTCLPVVNLRPTQLTLSTFEGDILEEFDLTTLDLHRDVLVFDGDTGHLLDSDHAELRTGKSYVVVADADLSLEGVPRAEWESVGSRKAYRLNAPWSEDAHLLLENLEFWRPRVQQGASRPSLRVSLTVRDSERLFLGDEVTLVAEGVPEDTESATLLLGSGKVELERRDESWATSRGVVLSPELVLGLEKQRIRIRRYTQAQTVPVKLGFEPRGAAVYERDPSSGESGRWRRLSEEQPLNISSDKTQIRLLGMDLRKGSVLYEGCRSVGAVSHRGSRLAILNLYGWGSPLVATEEDTRRPMASSVEHHGCVFYVIHNLFGREDKTPPLIHLRAPVAPSADHSVWAWSVNHANPTDVSSIHSEAISVENEGLVWRIGMLPHTHAIGLAFRGERLGSWWDSRSLNRLLRGEMNVRLFALLRWFRIPVLSKALSYMQGAVHKAPLDFLRAWLGCQGLPEELKAKPSDEGIRGVVRQLFWDWRERPSLVDKMIPFFREICAAPVVGVNPGMVGVAETCPPLLWAWRSRLPVGDAQVFHHYLLRERLRLKNDIDLHVLSRHAKVSYKTLRNVRTNLETETLSSILLDPSVRELGESSDGRAVLSALILEEVMKNRKNRKG
jgi:hypothetical protein